MPYWSLNTMAAELDISLRLAQKLVASNAIPSIKLPEPQRGRRVRSEDALAWATSRSPEKETAA